jgi:hypothetical protein
MSIWLYVLGLLLCVAMCDDIRVVPLLLLPLLLLPPLLLLLLLLSFCRTLSQRQRVRRQRLTGCVLQRSSW